MKQTQMIQDALCADIIQNGIQMNQNDFVGF